MSQKLLLVRCANRKGAPPWCNPQPETTLTHNGPQQHLHPQISHHLQPAKFQSQNQEVTYTTTQSKNNGPKPLHHLLPFQLTLLSQASNMLSLKTLTSTLSPISHPPPITSLPTVSPPTPSAVLFTTATSLFFNGNSVAKFTSLSFVIDLLLSAGVTIVVSSNFSELLSPGATFILFMTLFPVLIFLIVFVIVGILASPILIRGLRGC